MRILLLLMILSISLSSPAQSPEEQAIEFNNDRSERDEEGRADESSDRDAIDEALGNLNSFIDRLEKMGNAYNTIENFNPNSCSPDFGSSPDAMMPSSCDGNEACGECYTKAVGELNFIRRQLGRLSCIYNETKKFNEAAISFGDNTSGVHAVAGLSWQSARRGIVQQFEKFQGTYDRKYADMMGALDRALKAIGGCEAQYGLPDWYQRFGFIYYEFMKDKYRRTD